MSKKILTHHYIFVGSSDSKIGMHTMSLKPKRDNRCLYLFRLRPKAILPSHVDYLWKGKEEMQDIEMTTMEDDEHKHHPKREELRKILEVEETKPTEQGVTSEGDEEKKEELEEANFMTLDHLMKSELSHVEIHSSSRSKSGKISKLHHFQQLAAPDFQSISSQPLTTHQLRSHSRSEKSQDLTGSLSGYHNEIRGGTELRHQRVCSVDNCLLM